MNIRILTANFYPIIHPRAFRSYELAKEFAKRGHNVEVLCLTKVLGFDYSSLEKERNIKITHLNLYTTKTNIAKSSYTEKNVLKNLLRIISAYFLGGRLFINAWRICKYLTKYHKDDVDLFIALSTPFMDILGTALYAKKHKIKGSFVADSGDPFYYSQQLSRAFYFKYIEKWCYKKFNYLSIPFEKAKEAYLPLISDSKIRIIPQGFNFEECKVVRNVENNIITFGYAGVFYDDIRNPKFIFDYLCSLEIPFKFKIYLREHNGKIDEMLSSYKNILGDKLEIYYSLKREDLIFKLSQCDFLLNIDNLVTTQLPSKLIDYGISGRPIYSCNINTFVSEIFDQFLDRNYSNQLNIDISRHDIRVIANSFESLVDK